jgi:hypothetical protein
MCCKERVGSLKENKGEFFVLNKEKMIIRRFSHYLLYSVCWDCILIYPGLFMQFITVLKYKQHKFIDNFYNYSMIQAIITE